MKPILKKKERVEYDTWLECPSCNCKIRRFSTLTGYDYMPEYKYCECGEWKLNKNELEEEVWEYIPIEPKKLKKLIRKLIGKRNWWEI